MLYITYDNKLDDGAGAQLLRIITAYFISKKYDIGYIHSPLKQITNYGLSCLENKFEDKEQLVKYNKLFELKSTNNNIVFDKIVECKSINYNMIKSLKGLSNSINNLNILLKVSFPVFEINNDPSLLNFSKYIYFEWLEKSYNNILKICIHIRRGDILLIETDIRYLPNSFYINIMKAIQNILQDKIKYEFHIYTENVTKPTQFTQDYRTDFNNVNKLLIPETYEDFFEFKNIVWHINTNPVDSFIELCNADMLVISKSAFSYLPAILNKKAIVFCPDILHHPPKDSWIKSSNYNNIYNYKDYILNHYITISNILAPIKYISGGALGDFIHQLGIIKSIYEKTGKKAILYISHTARATDKFPFGLEQAYNDTYKLITSQEYIESYHIHNNEPYDINLSSWVVNQQLYKNNWYTIFKNEYNIEWCMNKYIDIETDSLYKDCIFISSSIKRFNNSIDYNKLFSLLPYRPIFITSIISEYDYFKSRTGINLEYICFNNLYDLYKAINSCKLFIGNLSSPLTIAQACFKPRICILDSNKNANDNIHMKDLELKWNNCIYIYNLSDEDINNVNNLCNKLFII